MEFYLDVDGVILDFEGSFMSYLRQNHLPNLPEGYRPQTWEMDNEFKGVDIGLVWEEFVVSHAFTQLECLVDPVSFNRLSTACKLYLITNLPQAQYQSRKVNLENHRLRFNGLHLAGHHDFGIQDYPTKSEAIARLRNPNKAMVFLDDHPANCLDVKTAFPEAHVFLMSRPHNRGKDDAAWIRVDDWAEFIKLAPSCP